MIDSSSIPVSSRPRSAVLAGVFALALAARGGLLAIRLVVLGIPPRGLGGSDVPGWLGMAAHLRDHLDFSYWLMGVRPPLFPLTVAAVSWLGGSRVHAAILQIVFGALTAVFGYLLARRLLRAQEERRRERLALLAGIVLALDPASVSASATLLADPLFNLTFTALLYHLTCLAQERRWRDLAWSAIWLALAMLTRPTAVYLWIAAPILILVLERSARRQALTLAAVGLAVTLGWSARNLAYTGMFTYTLQTNFTLLFMRALSAEHLATGVDTDTLQVAYARQLYRAAGDEDAARNVTPESFWDFHVAPSPAIYDEMGRLARAKLIQYWPFALASTVVGLWRMFALTYGLPGWFAPIELVYHALLYGLGLVGVWQAVRRRDWLLLVMAGVPILYVTGLTLASQTSAMDTRMRSPISAPLVVFAAAGLASMLSQRRQRQASASVTTATTATGINP
jgi:hypothetical protein